MLSLLLYAVGMAAQQPDWGYNPNAYPDEHVIYVGLVDDKGSAVQSFNANTYLGAFIDGECRGIAEVSQKSVSDTKTIYYFALRVKGSDTDNGKAISFRLSIPGTNMSYIYNDLKPAANAVTYTNKKTTGTLSALYPLTFIQSWVCGYTQTFVSVKVGEEINLLDYLKFTPENANIPELIWGINRNHREYVTITGNTLKALKSTKFVGAATVSAKLKDFTFSSENQSLKITVIQPATSIELLDEYKNGITVNLGDTSVLNTVLHKCFNILPEDCNEKMWWKSNDETAIRPMEGNDIGKFEPVKTGTYTMTLGGEKASVDLKVTVIKPVEYIEMVGSVKTIKMFVGENLLNILPAGYKVMPEDATDRSVKYEVNQSFSDQGVYEDGDGAYKYTDIFGDLYFNEGDEMIALKPGRVRVTINSTQNSRAYCEYEVIVKRGPTNITFKQEEMTFLMPRKDTDKWDISEDIRNNIIMTPSWPKYDE